MTKKEEIQRNLNNSALVIKKYDIGDEKYFLVKFKESEKSQLISALEDAEKKIKNKDIVKDASILTKEEIDKVTLRLNSFAFQHYRLFHFLSSAFDEKKLKLSDENIERRVRRIVAERYLNLIVEEVNILEQRRRNPVKFQLNYIRNNPKPFIVGFIYITVLTGLFSFQRIKNGLTSAVVLTERIHENSKYEYRIGAICRDGRQSDARGRGACSHHGGVSEWVYKTEYRKSLEECKKEATKISWID